MGLSQVFASTAIQAPTLHPGLDLPFPELVIQQGLTGECYVLFAFHTVREMKKEMVFH